MQTAGDAVGKIKALAGDPWGDWITPEYIYPLLDQAYQWAISYLKGSCSPYIRKRVLVPGVPLSIDESNLRPFNTLTQPSNDDPLPGLITPIHVEFRTAGTNNTFHMARECIELPETVGPVNPAVYDIRVWGDFLPRPLVNEKSVIEIHPNAAHALAMTTMAFIGAERPNEQWAEYYGVEGPKAWDQIVADLVRQQQHLPFRLGSPNRNARRSYPYNFSQGGPMWEWRSFELFMKLGNY